MGTGAAGALSSSSSAYVGWKEVFVSSDKGRRGVHYYLKRRDGASDLAVVGKEKSPGHINFRYVLQDRFLIGGSSPSLFLKMRSRREVIEWLNSIVRGFDGDSIWGFQAGNLPYQTTAAVFDF